MVHEKGTDGAWAKGAMGGEAPRQVVERFWLAMNQNDWRAAGQLLHDDYLLEWPQSSERIRGRDNFVAVNTHYPAAGPWHFDVLHLVADESGAASEVAVTDGAVVARAIAFFEVRDGLIVRMTEYWPDPFEAAEWRAGWVERTDRRLDAP